jgi:hypothetical protein
LVGVGDLGKKTWSNLTARHKLEDLDRKSWTGRAEWLNLNG